LEKNVNGENMKKWEIQIKKAPVQYSGTCPRCKKFVRGGDECPLKLPAKGEGLQASVYCPMRIPEKESSKSRNAFLRDD
jgi:hypothetical protein